MGITKKVAIAMILSIMLASCGGQKDNSLDKQTSIAEQLLSTITVQCRDGFDGIQGASDLRVEISEAEGNAVLRPPFPFLLCYTPLPPTTQLPHPQ